MKVQSQLSRVTLQLLPMFIKEGKPLDPGKRSLGQTWLAGQDLTMAGERHGPDQQSRGQLHAARGQAPSCTCTAGGDRLLDLRSEQ